MRRHIRLGQLEGRRLEFGHVRVAIRRVSRGVAEICREDLLPRLGSAAAGARMAGHFCCPSIGDPGARRRDYAAPLADHTLLIWATHLWQAKMPHILKADLRRVRQGSSEGAVRRGVAAVKGAEPGRGHEESYTRDSALQVCDERMKDGVDADVGSCSHDKSHRQAGWDATGWWKV